MGTAEIDLKNDENGKEIAPKYNGVVLPHDILFRGGTEGKIREGLLQDDLVEAIVGLPEKLFYNTGIPASIVVTNKSKAENLKHINLHYNTLLQTRPYQ